MKVCAACSRPIRSVQPAAVQSAWKCTVCGHEPPVMNGFLSFASGTGDAQAGFSPHYFEKLAALEAGNFWFRGRNRLIAWALRRYFPQAANFFEIGCGTGFVLSHLEHVFPAMDMSGSDFYLQALPVAARRSKNAQLFQMDARQLPFAEEFDVLGAFDVLEHVAEDDEVLLQMHRAVRRGGGIILTVPQHPFLWSGFDDVAGHVRRYRRQGLREKIERAGFMTVRMTSFVSLPFPLIYLTRLFPRKAIDETAAFDELSLRPSVNFVLERVLDVERCCIRAGLNFPFGSSLFVVAIRNT
jgi:SAM-dependent methyltransferase